MKTIRVSVFRLVLISALVSAAPLLGGCAVLGHRSHASGGSNVAHANDPLGKVFANESKRDRLNDGYSALYSELNGLSKVDDIFYVKIESDDVQHVVDNLTNYSGQLAKRLNSLSKKFPALDLHRTTTPPIIAAAHKAQRDGTLKTFAPVVGKSGVAFERGILIRLLGAADQERYLTQVLAAKEPNPALSKVMHNASQHFAQLFDQINALLKKRFYNEHATPP